jgi:integrase/recombinase XerD
MFLLSAKAALRAIEIAGLRWSHIRPDQLELTADITKGGKPRAFPLSSDLRAALDAYRAAVQPETDEAWLFPNRHLKGGPVSPNAVAQWFRYVYRQKLGWEGYSSHSGRRTAITAMARKVSLAGGSLRDVQDIAGHSSLSTTQGYIESSSDAKKRLVNMI